MFQVRLDRFGGPDVLRLIEAPDCPPGPGQVAVRVTASGISYLDTQLRTGRPPWAGTLPTLPAVLGNTVEGPVEAVGEGLDPALIGTRIATVTGGGGYADRVVVDASVPLRVPRQLPAGHGVTLIEDGATSLALERAAVITSVDRVLITAGAGAVGTLLVQLACLANARLVVALARGRAKLQLARDCGADIAIDYTAKGWEGTLAKVTGGVDVAFDGVGGVVGEFALHLVPPGGRAVVYGAASGTVTDVTRARSRGVQIIAGPQIIASARSARSLATEAIRAGAGGRIRAMIGQTFPLSQTDRAHAAIEAHQALAKTLLVPDATFRPRLRPSVSLPPTGPGG